MEDKVVSENARISEALYWEWRCTIEELKNAKTEGRQTHLQRELMQKDIEIKKLKMVLFQQKLMQADANIVKHKNEYEQIKQKIEKEIGHGLENCVIDDVTFEVSKIEEENINN